MRRSNGPRRYATVHVEDTDRLWSSHGEEAPKKSTEGGEREVTTRQSQANHVGTATEQRQSATVKPGETEKLEMMLRKRARRLPLRARTNIRNNIKDASASMDPLSALKALARARPGKAQADEPAKTPVEQIPVLDLNYYKETMMLPTREQYPRANARLFNPLTIAEAINEACQALRVSMQTDIDYTIKPTSKPGPSGLKDMKVCNLNLTIPDICQERAIGEGPSKAAAKKAAWLHVVASMHANSTLKELFPDPELTSAPQSNGYVTAEALPELANVDERTLEEEKDAKIEIYNYAAGLGLVPFFEISTVVPQTPRARRGRIPTWSKPIVHVTITLEKQGIRVTAAGKSLQTAEVAAAIAFKQRAEEQHRTSGSTQRSQKTILNTENAKPFFDFYKSRKKGLNIEMEHEQITQAGSSRNKALLTIDDKPIGHGAIMTSKKQADAVAYLIAAVELSTSDHQMLEDFEQALKAGKGKVLRPLQAIDLEVNFPELQTMRTALVEARNAGLPDSRQTLGAEVSSVNEHVRPKRTVREPSWHRQTNERLVTRQQQLETDHTLETLRSKKAALPMSQYRDQIIDMISSNQYSIVIGATGSGKTTQVPQILFENDIRKGKGSLCNIVCTQPRRIAATSVAQRVANERNEKLRISVGYQVRFDARLPYDPYGITYCTTGILLEKLKHDPDYVLDSTSHILIDEVHERDLNIDFLMIVLKRAIQTRQTEGKTVPKVVLMSATMESDRFANYFGCVGPAGDFRPCPSISVPGRTFPVKEKYLGSIMHDLFLARGSEMKRLCDEDPKTKEYLKVETAFSANQNATAKRTSTDPVIDWRRERQVESDSDDENIAVREKDEALVPIALIAATVAQISTVSQDGAILVFLPGLEEILQVERMLRSRPILGADFSDSLKFKICLLHSTVPKEQQDEIFEQSPPGCRKIILSTNIAETSVTVTDVKYVVDTGKLREKRYDQIKRITRLQCVWESKSNSRQRAGRAGRVQNGFYYALYSKERAGCLRAVGLPELLRSDLQETCLSIQAQNFGEPVVDFLAQAIEPPPKKAIEAAIDNLIAIEALTSDQSLTALGRLLSKLPVHPTLGKMIVLGVIFRCLDPMLVLGAAAEERPLFLSPLVNRSEAKRIHKSYAGDSQSDLLGLLEAFKELKLLQDQYGTNAAWQRARENYLHMGAFRTIDQTAKQIKQILVECRLIPSDSSKSASTMYSSDALNLHSENSALIKCLLLAGFHPSLAAKQTSNGVTFRTPGEDNVIIHPSSLNAEGRRRGERHNFGTLSAYSTLTKSNDGHSLFMRDSTVVSALMAVLFGGQLQVLPNGRLEMDEWLPFFVKSSDRPFASKLVLEFRKGLDRVLNGAFGSLSNLSTIGEQQFADDPILEKFASRVVEVLDRSSGRHVLKGPKPFSV